eukprot:gene56610-77583_t
MGLDRIAMLKYGMPDLRDFFNADVRWMNHYGFRPLDLPTLFGGLSGGCRCGAIRFEAASDPFYASYCHCSDCRQASGAPVAAFVGFRTADFRYSGESRKTYGKAPVKRSFCNICGAPIAYADARLPDQIFVMLGAMDRPEDYPPRLHGYAEGRLIMKFTLSWLKTHLDTDAALEAICERLTLIGLEVEGVDDKAAFKPFVIARVLTAEKHPQADKLKVLSVDT